MRYQAFLHLNDTIIQPGVIALIISSPLSHMHATVAPGIAPLGIITIIKPLNA